MLSPLSNQRLNRYSSCEFGISSEFSDPRPWNTPKGITVGTSSSTWQGLTELPQFTWPITFDHPMQVAPVEQMVLMDIAETAVEADSSAAANKGTESPSENDSWEEIWEGLEHGHGMHVPGLPLSDLSVNAFEQDLSSYCNCHDAQWIASDCGPVRIY
jgi:hypothetical protein